ncbi:MAG: hypothetical protein DRH51_05630 [Candidatus Coatesbacteria bacterium]|nr:MAG: hypothetical protein DRH51_05630 [Candidatus Coatesbacteria bacterium]RLC43485.1 MAG: hypothetical protein DRH44_04820 [Candidatus Coatesbacteria bacterium]RLC43500.1 MAG: hypothetical protein DRH49_01025 [Candidatus Coatesbacteria bacterium]
MFLIDELFELSEFTFRDIFSGIDYPWDVLKIVEKFIKQVGHVGVYSDVPVGAHIVGEPVYIGKDCRIEPNVFIEAPAIIWDRVQVRSGAYIRGNVIVDSGSVIGHSSELKNCILMRDVEVPHFNYIGDSVLGNRSHTGAGVILSNYKISAEKGVKVRINNKNYDTGLRKFGALLGDDVEIGCNCVLNPGTIIGKETLVYGLSLISGYIPSKKIVKNKPEYLIIDKK